MRPTRSGTISAFGTTGSRIFSLIALLAVTGTGYAQSITLYSYDSLQRVVQATRTDGVSAQYQYDANGNLLSVTFAGASALSVGTPLNVSTAAPGQSAMLHFSAPVGGSATLRIGSISTTPAGSPVTISVYSSSGTLVTSISSTSGTTLNLSSLAGGSYSVVIAPRNSSTAAAQVTLVSVVGPSSGDADVPLPLWALLTLGGGLLGIMRKFAQRSSPA